MMWNFCLCNTFIKNSVENKWNYKHGKNLRKKYGQKQTFSLQNLCAHHWINKCAAAKAGGIYKFNAVFLWNFTPWIKLAGNFHSRWIAAERRAHKNISKIWVTAHNFWYKFKFFKEIQGARSRKIKAEHHKRKKCGKNAVNKGFYAKNNACNAVFLKNKKSINYKCRK